ncbi:MAG: HlyD family type I secretion periplasmic adaptor subunit [Alphaproteobacteria bacterium]
MRGIGLRMAAIGHGKRAARGRETKALLRSEDEPFVGGLDGAGLHRPRRFAHILLFAIVLFFVLFIAWASFATLDEVTRGEGRVIPSSQVQVVQNLEGGIVADILVREAQIVEAGDTLLRIDNIEAASDLRGARQRHLALLGAIARLQAEIEERGIDFPPDVMAEARRVAIDETALFNARQAALQSELEILRNQANQRDQEVAELETRLGQLERSAKLATDELEITEPLAAKRVVSKVDLLRLQRQVNDLQGELEGTRLSLPRLRLAQREAHRRIEERYLNFQAEAQRELTTVQTEAAALAEVIAADSDRVNRTDVRSPVRGTIKRLLINTIGGVIKPGQDLVEIVPLEDTLLVEAQIRPADIAFLRPDQAAVVKVTAYDYAVYGGLDAEVESISADSITDDRGDHFFRVRVRTDSSSLDKGGEPLPIIPGMTTQVDILTGQKTVMDYLMKPILRIRDEAFRER